MQHTNARRRTGKVKPRFWLIVMSSIVLLFTVHFISRGSQIRQLEGVIAQKQQEINETSLMNQELERKYTFLQTDQYVEQEARRRYGYLKPGETRFMIGDASQVSGVVTAWQQEMQATGGTDTPQTTGNE